MPNSNLLNENVGRCAGDQCTKCLPTSVDFTIKIKFKNVNSRLTKAVSALQTEQDYRVPIQGSVAKISQRLSTKSTITANDCRDKKRLPTHNIITITIINCNHSEHSERVHKHEKSYR